MSSRTVQDNEKFLDDLDKAFNTPSNEVLVVPRVSPKCSDAEHGKGKRRRDTHDNENNGKKRRACENSCTGVGIRTPPTDKSKPVRKNGGKRRSMETAEAKLSDLLDGMVLFFIPNSKKNGVRKFRMNLFERHGADVRDTWSSDVTHIICDKNIFAERIVRDLALDEVPVLN